jgi:hypothetical protein
MISNGRDDREELNRNLNRKLARLVDNSIMDTVLFGSASRAELNSFPIDTAATSAYTNKL